MAEPTINMITTCLANSTAVMPTSNGVASKPAPAAPAGAASATAETVWAACTRIIGDDAGPMPPLDAQLLDYGLDSLGLADLGELIMYMG